MSQQIVQIDAFTSEPYRGNPAAVCVLKGPADEEWMALVAREMNLSETAYVYPIDGGFHLRWFTPRAEVDLCGHATLATAHLLWQDGHVPGGSPVRFQTRSGWVSASRESDWIVLDFPVNRPQAAEASETLLEILGFTPVFVGRYPSGIFVVAPSDEWVRKLEPNLYLLQRLPEAKLCVTARDSAGEVDVVSRLFAPALGIPEDPVNGNSHTVLGPYWSAVLGRQEFTSKYVSVRGGMIRVEMAGDRVKIKGQAVTVMRATLSV